MDSPLARSWERSARDEWSMGTLRTTVFPNIWQHASDDHAVATRPYSKTRETNVQHFIDWYLAALEMPRPAPPKPKLRSIGYKDRPGA
jgi:hypothetical protein